MFFSVFEYCDSKCCRYAKGYAQKLHDGKVSITEAKRRFENALAHRQYHEAMVLVYDIRIREIEEKLYVRR